MSDVTGSQASADSGPGAVDPDIPTSGRSLSTVAYVIVIVVYLAVVQGVPYLSTAGLDDIEYGVFPDTETVFWALVVPVGVSMLFAIAVVTWLGWWPQILRDHRPVNRWVRIVPILMVVAIVVGTDYADLFDTSVGFVVLFVVGALMVGFTEETMFRGIGVTAFRANGYSEPRVALWVAVLFGLAHGTNLFTEGLGALLQIFVTAVAGFFFYLVLRVSGSLVVAMVLHGLWDFGLFSSRTTDELYVGGAVFLLVDVILAIVLLVRRHQIGLDPATVAT